MGSLDSLRVELALEDVHHLEEVGPSWVGSEGPPWCHAAVGAKIEWRASSSGRTGVQARQQLLKPCSRTIGSPVPPGEPR